MVGRDAQVLLKVSLESGPSSFVWFVLVVPAESCIGARAHLVETTRSVLRISGELSRWVSPVAALERLRDIVGDVVT